MFPIAEESGVVHGGDTGPTSRSHHSSNGVAGSVASYRTGTSSVDLIPLLNKTNEDSMDDSTHLYTSQETKTSFREYYNRIERTLRTSLFSSLQRVQRYNATPIWWCMIVFLIETCQLLAFCFDERFNWNWTGGARKVMRSFLVLPGDTILGFYLLYIYFALFVLMVVVLSVFLKNKWRLAHLPAKCLYYLSKLLPIANIPFAYYTMEMVVNAQDSEHVFYGEKLTFFSGLHLSYSLICIVIFPIATILTMFWSLCAIEQNPLKFDRIFDAKVNGFMHLRRIFVGILLSVSNATISYENSPALLASICLLSGLYLLYHHLQSFPQYSEIMGQLYSAQACVLTWISFSLLVAVILPSEATDGAALLCFGALPVICLLSVLATERAISVIVTAPVDQITDPAHFEIKVRFLLKLARRELNHARGDEERERVARQAYEQTLQMAESWYDKGCQRFAEDPTLHIMFASFFFVMTNNRALAYREMALAEDNNPPLNVRYILSWFNVLIANEEQSAQSHDVLSYIEFKTRKANASRLSGVCRRSMRAFWTELLRKEPDVDRLRSLGIRSYASMMEVSNEYVRLLEISPNSLPTLRGYCHFLTKYTFNNKLALSVRKLADELEDARASMNKSGDGMALDFLKIQEVDLDIFDERNAVIGITLEEGRIGEIISCNTSGRKLFNYKSVTQLMGQNISTVIPEPIASQHNGMLLEFLQRNQSKILDSTRMVVGRSSDGYIFPINIYIRWADTAAASMIGVLQPIRTHDQYFMMERVTQRITYITKKFERWFRLSVSEVESGLVFLNDLFPSLRRERSGFLGGVEDDDVDQLLELMNSHSGVTLEGCQWRKKREVHSSQAAVNASSGPEYILKKNQVRHFPVHLWQTVAKAGQADIVLVRVSKETKAVQMLKEARRKIKQEAKLSRKEKADVLAVNKEFHAHHADRNSLIGGDPDASPLTSDLLLESEQMDTFDVKSTVSGFSYLSSESDASSLYSMGSRSSAANSRYKTRFNAAVKSISSAGSISSDFASRSRTHHALVEVIEEQSQQTKKQLKKLSKASILIFVLAFITALVLMIISETILISYETDVAHLQAFSARETHAQAFASLAQEIGYIGDGATLIAGEFERAQTLLVEETSVAVLHEDQIYRDLKNLGDEQLDHFYQISTTVEKLVDGVIAYDTLNMKEASEEILGNANLVSTFSNKTASVDNPLIHYLHVNGQDSIFNAFSKSTQLHNKFLRDSLENNGNYELYGVISFITVTSVIAVAMLAPAVAKVEQDKNDILQIFMKLPVIEMKKLLDHFSRLCDHDADTIDNLDNSSAELNQASRVEHQSVHKSTSDKKEGKAKEVAASTETKAKQLADSRNSEGDQVNLLRRDLSKLVFKLVLVALVLVAYFFFNYFMIATITSKVEEQTKEVDAAGQRHAQIKLAFGKSQDFLFSNDSAKQATARTEGQAALDLGYAYHQGVLFGSDTLGLHGTALDASNQIRDLYFGNACDALYSHFRPYDRDGCSTFAHGLVTHGVQTVFIRMDYDILAILDASNAGLLQQTYPVNSTQWIHQQKVLDTFQEAHQIIFGYLDVALDQLSVLYIQDIENYLDEYVLSRVLYLVLYTCLLLILFFVVVSPAFETLGSQQEQTTSMILILPPDIISKTQAIKDFLDLNLQKET